MHACGLILATAFHNFYHDAIRLFQMMMTTGTKSKMRVHINFHVDIALTEAALRSNEKRKMIDENKARSHTRKLK